MTALQVRFEIRPEFRKQVGESGASQAGPKMNRRRSSRAARRRIVNIRKSGTHGRARHICPIESVSAAVGLGNQRAADGVTHPLPEPSIARPSSHVDRVLMKRGSHQEIAEEVLGGDIRG